MEGTVKTYVVVTVLEVHRAEKKTVCVHKGVWMDGQIPTAMKVKYNRETKILPWLRDMYNVD